MWLVATECQCMQMSKGKVRGVRIFPDVRGQSESDKSPPRCRLIRPSGSSETSAGATVVGAAPRSRISWSSATGDGPSRCRILLCRSAVCRRFCFGAGVGSGNSGNCGGWRWPSASITSSALLTNVAPSRIKILQPAVRPSNGCPGTANTSRDWSSALRAVIRLQDLAAASITTTPIDRPDMIRLRAGKWRAWGCIPMAISDRRRPDFAISWVSAVFSVG